MNQAGEAKSWLQNRAAEILGSPDAAFHDVVASRIDRLDALIEKARRHPSIQALGAARAYSAALAARLERAKVVGAPGLVELIQKEAERATAAIVELEEVVAGLRWDEPWLAERAGMVDSVDAIVPTTEGGLATEATLPSPGISEEESRRFGEMRRRVSEAVSNMGLDSTAPELRGISWSLAEHGKAWMALWVESHKASAPEEVRTCEVELAHLEDAFARAEGSCLDAMVVQRIPLLADMGMDELEQRVRGLDIELRRETARHTKLALEGLKNAGIKSSNRFRSVVVPARQPSKPYRERNIQTLQAWFGSIRTRANQFLDASASESKQAVRLHVQAIASEMSLMMCEHRHLEVTPEVMAVRSEAAALRDGLCQVVKTRLRTMPQSIRHLECCDSEPEALSADYEADKASLNAFLKMRQQDGQGESGNGRSELDATIEGGRTSGERQGDNVRVLNST